MSSAESAMEWLLVDPEARPRGCARPRRQDGARLIALLVGVLWLSLTAAGFSWVWAYAGEAGDPGSPPRVWPGDPRISAPDGVATLLLFAHPRCPCSRASIGELDRLRAQCKEEPSVHVVFYRPRGTPRDWSMTDLWEHAASIPGVSVWSDEAGQMARRFGAVTSGQVLLYDGRGALVFQGGITPGRGHAGDNPGRDAIAALVHGRTPSSTQARVYGCTIMTPRPQETAEAEQGP